MLGLSKNLNWSSKVQSRQSLARQKESRSCRLHHLRLHQSSHHHRLRCQMDLNILSWVLLQEIHNCHPLHLQSSPHLLHLEVKDGKTYMVQM